MPSPPSGGGITKLNSYKLQLKTKLSHFQARKPEKKLSSLHPSSLHLHLYWICCNLIMDIMFTLSQQQENSKPQCLALIPEPRRSHSVSDTVNYVLIYTLRQLKVCSVDEGVNILCLVTRTLQCVSYTVSVISLTYNHSESSQVQKCGYTGRRNVTKARCS